jgi:hypothetical protein
VPVGEEADKVLRTKIFLDVEDLLGEERRVVDDRHSTRR